MRASLTFEVAEVDVVMDVDGLETVVVATDVAVEVTTDVVVSVLVDVSPGRATITPIATASTITTTTTATIVVETAFPLLLNI